MRSTFKILFYLNTSRRKKSGLCPVMGRITVDGSIAQFSLKEDVHPARWDAKKGRAKGKSREQMELNRKIEQTEHSVRSIYRRTVDATGCVTAEQIKNELTGATAKAEMLLELFGEHNREYKKRVGIDRKGSTYYRYENSYGHLSRFIQSKYGITDFPLKRLDLPFINDYEYYLRVDAGLSASPVIKNIIYLKKMAVRAMNQRIILRNPFQEYVPGKTTSKYLHISKEELERIMTARFKSKSVGFIRDMFVFSCFTGLAYADIRLLSDKHLRKMPDGSIWIKISRYKTGVESNIMLLDIPLSIIGKYRTENKDGLLFKIPSNSSVCSSMREIEKLCNIEHLHFHMARHTFATLICMANGVSMESLSKMMGHSSMRSTQIYAEITGQKVGDEMKKLAERTKRKKQTSVYHSSGT